MELENLIQYEVECVIEKLLKDRTDICTCDKCRLDISAISLNNLKPKYVVTDKGRLYAKLETLSYQYETDVTIEVTKAIKIVSGNPRHEEI